MKCGGREGGGQPAQLYRDCAAEELALGVVVDGDGESKVLVGDGRVHRNIAELLEMQLQQNNGDHRRQHHMNPKLTVAVAQVAQHVALPRKFLLVVFAGRLLKKHIDLWECDLPRASRRIAQQQRTVTGVPKYLPLYTALNTPWPSSILLPCASESK